MQKWLNQSRSFHIQLPL